MKKRFGSVMVLVVLMTVILCGCGAGSNTADTSGPALSAAAGHSLEEVALQLNSGMMAQQEVTEQDVGIRGTATEVFARSAGKQVSALYVQAFYRDELGQGGVQAGSQTLSQETLEPCTVYEDDEIVVYDLSNYLYGDTMNARMEEAGLEENSQAAGQINECISRLDTLIVPEDEVGEPEQVPTPAVEEITHQIAL